MYVIKIRSFHKTDGAPADTYYLADYDWGSSLGDFQKEALHFYSPDFARGCAENWIKTIPMHTGCIYRAKLVKLVRRHG